VAWHPTMTRRHRQ